MIALRDYQEELIDEVRREFKQGIKRPCIVAPCGSGKTVIMAWMANQSAHNGKQVWFLVHRQELIDQSVATFYQMGIRVGIIGSGMGSNERIQIGSIFTAARRLKTLVPPDLIIFDEAHHSVANTWKNILKAYPNAWCIGLTATPVRLNGSGLGEAFQSLVMGPSVIDLIEQGNLARYRYFAPEVKANLADLRMDKGDYQKAELAMRMDKAEIIGDALTFYQERIPNKRAVVYCAGIEHSQHVAAMFSAAGIPAAHIDGKTKDAERRRIIESFRNDEIKILSNVDLISEGFDVPSMEAVIMLRPTASTGLYIQQAMRPMRPDRNNPEKIAYIIDHVGNVHRHGMPDEERQWSLEAKLKRRAGAAPIRQCPKCYAVQPAAQRVCSACGHVFEIAPKDGPKEKPGDLQEITEEERDRRRLLVRKARTRRDFEQIAFECGYKLGWVNRQCQIRGIS